MKTLTPRFLMAALSFFVLACVVRAPISLVTLFLPRNIQLKNVEGSLWNGRASAIGVGGFIVQEGVHWRFEPQSLRSARLAWRISGRFGEQKSQLLLAVGIAGIESSEASVYAPLEPLATLHPKAKMAQLGALLHWTSQHLSTRAPAKVSLDIDQLFTALLPQTGPLGRYQLVLDLGADGKGRWSLSSHAGVLGAVGEGQLDLYRNILAGRLVLTPSAAIPGLTPLLGQLPRLGEGFVLTL